MTRHRLALPAAPPVLCCYLRKLLCVCFCVWLRAQGKRAFEERQWRKNAAKQRAKAVKSTFIYCSVHQVCCRWLCWQAKDARKGLRPYSHSPSLFKRMLTYSKTHTQTHFSQCSSIISFKKTPVPPHQHPTPEPLMPLHEFVRLLRKAAKFIHARQILRRPAFANAVSTTQGHWRVAFFLAVYDDLVITEVWDQPLLYPKPCHSLGFQYELTTCWNKAQRRNTKPPSPPPASMPTPSAGALEGRCSSVEV